MWESINRQSWADASVQQCLLGFGFGPSSAPQSMICFSPHACCITPANISTTFCISRKDPFVSRKQKFSKQLFHFCLSPLPQRLLKLLGGKELWVRVGSGITQKILDYQNPLKFRKKKWPWGKNAMINSEKYNLIYILISSAEPGNSSGPGISRSLCQVEWEANSTEEG